MADNESLNPYASPTEVSSDCLVNQNQPLLRLHAPALGLMILATFWGGICAIGTGVLTLSLMFQFFGVGFPSGDEDLLNVFFGWVVSASCGFIAYGAICSRYGVRYRLVQVAAFLACIPFLSPGIWLGIPFGIWTLVLLHRKDVRGAFSQVA